MLQKILNIIKNISKILDIIERLNDSIIKNDEVFTQNRIDIENIREDIEDE